MKRSRRRTSSSTTEEQSNDNTSSSKTLRTPTRFSLFHIARIVGNGQAANKLREEQQQAIEACAGPSNR
jgi:hypothetical protein